MKTTNKITIAIAILLAILMIFLSFGCNPSRQIQKAEQRVLLDPVARHNVFLKELQFYPCANDSIRIFIPGKPRYESILTLTEVPIFDSFAYKIAIQNVDDQCNDRIKEAFDLGVDYASSEFKKIKVVRAVDTFKYSIIDNQIIKLVQDSLTKAEKHIYGLDQQNIIQRERLDERRKESEKYLIWFILSIVILVGSNLLWFKIKLGKNFV